MYFRASTFLAGCVSEGINEWEAKMYAIELTFYFRKQMCTFLHVVKQNQINSINIKMSVGKNSALTGNYTSQN